MKGITTQAVLILIGLVVLIVAITKPSFLTPKIKSPQPNIASESATLTPTPTAPAPNSTASPTSSPKTTSSFKTTPPPIPAIDCTISAASETVPPYIEHSFTAGLLNRTDPIKSVDWDVNGDGKIDFPQQSSGLSYKYQEPGSYNVKARVTLENGTQTRWCSKTVQVKYNGVSCDLYISDDQAKQLTSYKAPLKVCLHSGASGDSALDKDGVEGYQWDFDGDGNWDTSMENYGSICRTFNDPKNYNIKMLVKMKSGRSASCSINLNVTN